MNNSVVYLKTVLSQCKEFCKSHKRFESAIDDVLSENNSLKNQVVYLRYRVNELEKQLKGGVNNDC